MRIRLSNRLALASAIAVVVMTLGAAHAPVTSTFASSHVSGASRDVAPLAANSALTASDFQPVAQQGFGDPNNTFAWSMEWYKGHLYVGTNRDWLCVQQALYAKIFPWVKYPPKDPDVTVPCASAIQNMPLAAEIWRFDPAAGTPYTQTNWTRVYQSPYTATVNIAGTNAITQAPRDTGFRGMSIFDDGDANGPALYVSGVGTTALNGAQVPPPSLLRTTNGAAGTWQAVPADPGTTLGGINALGGALRGSVTYNGKFYVNIGNVQGAGAAYVSATPQLGDNTFQRLTPPGMSVYEMAVYNGHLYIGVQSYFSGYSVVELNDAACTSLPCPASAFTTIVPGGGGLGSQGNFSITSMHVFTPTTGSGAGVGYLYVGTDGEGLVHQPAELVRINPDNSWDLVVGKPRTINGVTKVPISGYGAGFNWLFNAHMWRMEDYNGVLYVGTFDNSTSYKDTLLGPFLLPWMGFDIYASSDGINFTPVTINGFGYIFNIGARTMKATPYGLFVGSSNIWKGLRVWLGSVPGQALQLAPSNLQIADTARPGKAALSWDAPGDATIFHIYRAIWTSRHLPSLPAGAQSSDPDVSQGVAPHALTAASIGSHAPSTVWIPSAYTEVGTTTNRYFLDHSAQAGAHYSYYVVAQNARGHVSASSNVALDLVALPTPTFSSVASAAANLAERGDLTGNQLARVQQTLRTAFADLRGGATQRGLALLDALRRNLQSQTSGVNARMAAAQLAIPLARLEGRVALVKAHILTASDVR